MKPLKPTYLLLFTLSVIIWSSCSSGKSAFNRGNYYDAVITSINRLRRNTDNKKSSETLRSAYPLALKYYGDMAIAAQNSNAEYKWKEVIQHYSTLQSMYDEIQRSPGALKVIPNPTNFQPQLANARQKAAEENYNGGILALGLGNRIDARRAYLLFVNANEYVPGYKDVAKKIEEAQWAATTKVAVEPIPIASNSYSIDAQYFDSRLNEYLLSSQPNQFTKFYRLVDAKSQKINPDHIVQLSFDEFSIGQVYLNEKESQEERDSIVVAYTVADAKGNLMRSDIESPKILPSIKPTSGFGKTVDTKTTDTNSGSTTGKIEEKKPEEKKPEEIKGEEKKPEEKKVEDKNPEKKIAEETKVEEKKVEEKKSEEKITEEKKSKEEEKNSEEKKNEEKKSDDKKDDEKKDDEKKDDEKKGEKSDAGNDNDKKETGKPDDQVTICHQPPGKPSERKTLKVSQSAVKAHLAHGDVLGECKSDGKDGKGKDGSGNGGDMPGLTSINQLTPFTMFASTSKDLTWLEFEAMADTTKIFGKVKATVRHFKKTITSQGVLNFKIVDTKTGALIAQQRMPSESVWVSEWLTYNGDSRALSPEQLNLAAQKELPVPTKQEMFVEFTKPLFNQITAKINEFYSKY